MPNKKKATVPRAATAPDVPAEKNLRQFENYNGVLFDDDEHSEISVSNGDLIEQDAHDLVLKNSRLHQVKFGGSNFPRAQVVDVRIESCDFANTDCPELRMNKVEIFNTKFTGMKAFASKFSDCVFDGCVGNLAQFHGAKFKSTYFRNCKLRDADFRAADLSGAVFIESELDGSEFYDANLQGADFRGADISKIKIHTKDLKGAIINSAQALELATHLASLLGIQVSDD